MTDGLVRSIIRGTDKKNPPQLRGIVPKVGIEPTLLTEHDFESCASANSATPA